MYGLAFLKSNKMNQWKVYFLFLVCEVRWRWGYAIHLHFCLSRVTTTAAVMSMFLCLRSSFTLSIHVFGCLPVFLLPLTLQCITSVGNVSKLSQSSCLDFVTYFCLLESTCAKADRLSHVTQHPRRRCRDVRERTASVVAVHSTGWHRRWIRWPTARHTGATTEF